jgi:Ca-activated chloride channel family protein
MKTLATLEALIRARAAEWQGLPVDALLFWHRDVARLALLVLVAIVTLLLAWRFVFRDRATHGVGLPALLAGFGRPGSAARGATPSAFERRCIPPGGVAPPSNIPDILGRRALPAGRLAVLGATMELHHGLLAWLRHAPLIVFAAGLPFALLALADPYSALVQEDASFSGRRIGLMIDASTSMSTSFKTESLKTRSRNGAAFYTTVAAAEHFVQLRRQGQHQDLMALVEFGNQAYVITPFTSDYDNILLSIALISDPVEFSLFPDRGTIIAHAVDQSIDLFKAFDFLEASGNLMVIFTDGEDARAEFEGVSLDEILQGAIDHKIPLYFVRTNYQKQLGDIIPDALWKQAVEKTGGKFYAASDEASLLAAIHDINRLAAGTIRVKRYTTQQPRFAVFALLACGLWCAAAAVKLTSGRFQTLP